MNEKNAIQSYEIYTNEDGTYRVEIRTKAYTVSYDRAEIQFLTGDIIAFPVKMVAKDETGEPIVNWDLTSNPAENNNQQKPTEEEPLTGEVTK